MKVLEWLLSLFTPKVAAPFTVPAKPAPDAPSLAVKSGFSFAGRSLTRLATVKPRLQTVVHLALRKSVVDFAIVQGKRSLAEQKGLVAAGKSQTENSKHLDGSAIDVAAYVNGSISWEGAHYLCIATAFVYAAAEAGVAIRWGGAWHIPDIRVCAVKDDPGATMLALYKATRKAQGKGVFLDLGHFDLAE